MIVGHWLTFTLLTGLLGILVMTYWKPTKFVLYYHSFRIVSLSAIASAVFVVHQNKTVMILAAGLIPVTSEFIIRLEQGIFKKVQQLFNRYRTK